MNMYYDFDVKKLPSILEVGGKAESLMKLTKGGFNVPEGSVLTVLFFEEWLAELQNSISDKSLWKDPDNFKKLADRLKEKAKGLIYSERQKSIIYAIIKAHGEGDRYAVRSSSPEEDLSGASFAGGYETVLGVTKDSVFDAVKSAFVSCMDERVFFYKHQNGFDTSTLRIAVIIQKQIASEASGVGFSLNPLNNCFDEVVINANSGLGESVVSGMVTPDEFVIDKVKTRIVEKTVGSKEQAIVLDAVSGTRVVEGIRGKFSISDHQALELSALIKKVEMYYGFPVDIEWAYALGKLYLLQSRPITTYVPLPEEMQTDENEQPILYMDASLVKQGITTPLTILGGECISKTQMHMLENMMGKDVISDIKGGMATTRGGRMYMNVSSGIKFQGEKRFINTWKMVDVSTVELLENTDLAPYIPSKLPEAMRGAMWGTVKNNMGAIKYMRRAIKDPKAYKAWYQPFEDAFDNYLENVVSKDMGVLESVDAISTKYLELLSYMLPMTYAAELSRRKIGKMLDKHFDDGNERMQYLERSLPDNVTIDMGMYMYELSQMPEIKQNDYLKFNEALGKGKVSKSFEKHWSSYLMKFGCRTRNELDIGVPRAYENIEELFKQIKGMSDIDTSFSPKSIYDASQKTRQDTYNQLYEVLPGGMRKKLEKQYNILVLLGGKREALKYWYIRSLTAMREIVLNKAQTLVDKHVLDDIDDVFWLDLDQADSADRCTRSDVQNWIASNKRFYEKLKQVHQFPKLIDSRGRIIRLPKAEAKEGELVGQPISPGVVTGRVKILNAPDEKPLLPGEIMVTRATDPGWTPLFINASAILLEVGGLLQHGALVAREYGKPCVAGLNDVMEILQDGQLIEVDASRGIVRVLES